MDEIWTRLHETSAQGPLGFLRLDARPEWRWSPLESVGPLRFGMALCDVSAALGAEPDPLGRRGGVPFDATFQAGAVQTYYDTHGLAAVALSGLTGPRLVLDGVNLTGRRPSACEDRLAEREPVGSLVWSPGGELGSTALGLCLRVVRCGDVLVTRPVVSAAAWAERLGHAWEGPLPWAEWWQR